MVAIIQQNGKRRELKDGDVVKADARGWLYVNGGRAVLAPAYVVEGDDLRPGAINYKAGL